MLQHVVRSTVIDAPIDRVWAVLRDFNSHDRWHDVVAESRIEGDERSDQVGCVRSFTLNDGNRIREQLIALSDSEHKSTYCIVEATVPLQRYVATVTLKPVTDGDRTFWHWESTFATPPGRERELREMVARDVYEAGFANLRRHLREGGDRRGAGAAAMPSALPLPSRSAVVRRYGGPEVLQPERRRGAGARRRRSANPPARDRRQLPRRLPAQGLDPGDAAAARRAGHGGGRHGRRRRRGRQRRPPGRPRRLPRPGARRVLQRADGAGRVGRAPAGGVEDDVAAATLLKGITADFLLRDLGHVGAGTRLLVHAAAGGVGLLVCSWARRLGAIVIGTVSSEEKARVAREYGCAHPIVTSDHRFADAVQAQFGGADVIVDGIGDAARDENFAALARRGHWISLGQASGALQPIAADQLVQKSITFSRPAVFDYVATNAHLAERAQRVWAALADGTLKAPPIERHSLGAADAAHARLESRRTIGALVLIA